MMKSHLFHPLTSAVNEYLWQNEIALEYYLQPKNMKTETKRLFEKRLAVKTATT
jgi:hypothetical protein